MVQSVLFQHCNSFAARGSAFIGGGDRSVGCSLNSDLHNCIGCSVTAIVTAWFESKHTQGFRPILSKAARHGTGGTRGGGKVMMMRAAAGR